MVYGKTVQLKQNARGRPAVHGPGLLPGWARSLALFAGLVCWPGSFKAGLVRKMGLSGGPLTFIMIHENLAKFNTFNIDRLHTKIYQNAFTGYRPANS